MIQSGINIFKDLTYYLNGETVNLNFTITFPKAFNNPPVVVLNVLGGGFNFIANGYSGSDGGIVNHALITYALRCSKITSSNFVANLDVVTFKSFPPVDTIKNKIPGELIRFNWIAYDEVTIGA